MPLIRVGSVWLDTKLHDPLTGYTSLATEFSRFQSTPAPEVTSNLTVEYLDSCYKDLISGADLGAAIISPVHWAVKVQRLPEGLLNTSWDQLINKEGVQPCNDDDLLENINLQMQQALQGSFVYPRTAGSDISHKPGRVLHKHGMIYCVFFVPGWSSQTAHQAARLAPTAMHRLLCCLARQSDGSCTLLALAHFKPNSTLVSWSKLLTTLERCWRHHTKKFATAKYAEGYKAQIADRLELASLVAGNHNVDAAAA